MRDFSDFPFRLLEEWLSHKIVYDSIPSIAVGVTTSSEIIYTNTFGFADVENERLANVDTRYQVLSVTKPFTATAIMLLVERGLIRLDDTLSIYLPWLISDERSSAITIHHLLTHTSGLPREAPFPYWSSYDFPNKQQLQQTCEQISLVTEPGEVEKYSNLGYALLGQVIEQVSGRRFEQFVHDNIIVPLSMTRSNIGASADDNRAIGYTRQAANGDRQKAKALDAQAMAAAFGLSSTVKDVTAFVQQHLKAHHEGNGLLMPTQYIQTMHAKHGEAHDGMNTGLGFSVMSAQGMDVIAHSGVSNGFHCGISFSPQANIGLVVLTNCAYGPYGLVSHNLFSWLMADKHTPSPTAKDKLLQLYEGRYSSGYKDVVILEYYGELAVFELLDTFNPLSTKAALKPASEQHVFQWNQPYGDGKHLEHIEFVCSENSEVVGWRDSSGVLYKKVDEWL